VVVVMVIASVVKGLRNVTMYYYYYNWYRDL